MAKRNLVKTSFFLPRAVLRSAKIRALGEGISLREWLTRVVRAALAKPTNEEDR